MKSLRCPICGKAQDRAYRPFCSARCANVDLQRWLAGRYRLSEGPEDAQEGAPKAGDETPPTEEP
ncbi:MAG TPA: DNA gyrase inhibitor YacG [Caulobacteraceae bacterium]|nr:DNA gyrase inhibitor YacG [Caulobacteraceae bacterium]